MKVSALWMKSEIDAVDRRNYQFESGSSIEILSIKLWNREAPEMKSAKDFGLLEEVRMG